MENPNQSKTPGRRLGSWKEIAEFFGRGERTVRRWEKQRSLPVHRLPGGEKGGVFAFTEELARWQQVGGAERASFFEDASSESETEHGLEEPVATSSTGDGGTGALPLSDVPPLPGYRPFTLRTGLLLGLAALTLLAAAAVYEYGHSGASSSPAIAGSRPHAANPAAEELYLKGRFYWNKRTPEDLNKAVDYFTQAIVRDPSYASAYVGLADCYSLLREFSAMPDSEALPRALAAAKKAVELDPDSAEAHTTLAFARLYWNWDTASAEREFQIALSLDPKDVRAHHWYATSLMTMRRPLEALAQINIAQSLDPASKAILADKGLILYETGQHGAAVGLLRQIQASDPAFASPPRYLSYIFYRDRNYTEALRERTKFALLLHDHQELSITNAAQKGLANGGYKGMLEGRLKAQEGFYAQGSISPFDLAITCASLGKNKESLQYLQTAYDRREAKLLYLRGDDPELASLKDDPAFKDLLARIAVPRPD